MSRASVPLPAERPAAALVGRRGRGRRRVLARLLRRDALLVLTRFGDEPCTSLALPGGRAAGAPRAAMVTAGLSNGLVNAPIWPIFTLRTPPELRTKIWAAIVA